jgi:hypothetical protein
MDAREGRVREVPQLAGPRMPADRGLSSLGLLMQLGGTLFAAYMVLIALVPLFAQQGTVGLKLFLLGAAGAIRSGFHRAAGGALLYGSTRGVFRPTYHYIGVAAGQTLLTLLLLNQSVELPLLVNLSIGLLLVGWPLTLLVVLSRPRLRALAGQEVLPIAEDLGFEGSAVLMALFGVMGAFAALFMVYVGFKSPWGAPGPDQLLVVGVWAMLLARSILHAMAGVKGTRGIDSDGATEAAGRYFGVGIATAVIAGGALLILFISKPGIGPHPIVLMMVAAVVYGLLSWPLILRRFYTERNFSALLAGAEGPNQRRAPDAGMTAVGWLLLALGVLRLSLAVPAVLAGPMDLPSGLRELDLLDILGPSGLVDAARSPWWSIGVGLTQLWAGIELVHMTDRHRLAATIYGVIGSVVALYLLLPRLNQLTDVLALSEVGVSTVAELFRGAITLVVPVGTAILANRVLVPSAQARTRSSTAG